MKSTKIVAILSLVAGLVMLVSGVFAWATVRSELTAENIVVPGDSEFMGGSFKGKKVEGPLTAFAQAETIAQHTRDMAGGKTYAELPQDDPQRAVLLNAALLRSSLMTSVLSFGVAALVMGLGVLFSLIGWALFGLRPKPVAATPQE